MVFQTKVTAYGKAGGRESAPCILVIRRFSIGRGGSKVKGGHEQVVMEASGL